MIDSRVAQGMGFEEACASRVTLNQARREIMRQLHVCTAEAEDILRELGPLRATYNGGKVLELCGW